MQGLSISSDEMIKELTEQRKLLTANLETNLQDLQRAQGYVPVLGEESRVKSECFLACYSLEMSLGIYLFIY